MHLRPVLCLIADSGLSRNYMFAELISVDGYMERQATEAWASALYWHLGGGPHSGQSVQRLHPLTRR